MSNAHYVTFERWSTGSAASPPATASVQSGGPLLAAYNSGCGIARNTLDSFPGYRGRLPGEVRRFSRDEILRMQYPAA